MREIFRIIEEVNKKGVTILLIEQNANMALKTAHTGYVLETGRITMSGSGKELLTNESIKAAYLGTWAKFDFHRTDSSAAYPTFEARLF